MRKLVWATALWIGVSSTVTFAQDEPSATVKELMSVMRMDDAMSAGFDAMLPMVNSLSQQWQLDAEQAQSLKSIYRDWFENDFDQASIRTQLALEYDRVFSKTEMLEMIDFYETKTGQKVLDSLPQLTQLGAQLGMQEGQKKQHLLEQKVQTFYDENVDSQP